MSKILRPTSIALLAVLVSGCPEPDPTPAASDTEANNDDTTSTTAPPTTLDGSTTVVMDTTTSIDPSTGSTETGDPTTGGSECEGPIEPNEDIGSAVGRAVATGTNLGAGDHIENVCELRGVESEGESLSGTSGAGTGGSTSGATTVSDSGFDTGGGQAPTYEEFLVRWTAPAAGTYGFDLGGSDYDTVMSITDACGTSELGCNDDCFDLQSGISLDLAAGDTILIVIAGYSGGVGNFVLNISDAALRCIKGKG
jgi:hypothetical protein